MQGDETACAPRRAAAYDGVHHRNAFIAKVVEIMVDTFDFPPAEAQHRANLWLAEQHLLEGEVLAGVLPLMTPDRAQAELLRYTMQGDELAEKIREARELDIEL